MSSQSKYRSIRGRRQVKDVTIETYSSTESSSATASLLKAETSKKEKPSKKSTEEKLTSGCSVDKDEKTKSNVVDLRLEPITFVSGNPFVEVTKGILHLYKEE